MNVGPSKLEAVRVAREQLGGASPGEVAAFVERAFGIRLQPAIVAVLLASLEERTHLAALWERGREAIERSRNEQGGEGKHRRRRVARKGQEPGTPGGTPEETG